jgi:hypothetical protein
MYGTRRAASSVVRDGDGVFRCAREEEKGMIMVSGFLLRAATAF